MYRIEKYFLENKTEFLEDVLEVSESRLELVGSADSRIDGEILLRSRMENELHVFLSSNHYRMQCRVNEFVGKEGKLFYRFDTTGLEPGAVEKGELCVMSPLGEYHIPFSVTVKQSMRETSLGEIRNLFHFANLASENWDEAVQLFYSEDFSLLFCGHDRGYYNLYKGLSVHKNNEHNVDEFLVQIHKKKRNSYHVQEEGLLLKEVYDGQQEYLTVICDGWGYKSFSVETRGEFLEVVSTEMKGEDFEGNICRIPFCIRSSWLKSGSNIGMIIVSFEGGSVEVPVVVEEPYKKSKKAEQTKEARMLMMELARNYIMKRTTPGRQKEDNQRVAKVIDKLTSRYGRNLFARLCQVHVLLSQGELSEAKWILVNIEKNMQREEVTLSMHAFYLYLKGKLENDDSFWRSTKEQIRVLFEKNPYDMLLACIYARLFREHLSQKDCLEIYEMQYRVGCRNPLLYLETLDVLQESPVYLSKLDDFEISVMWFALRYGVYTRGLSERVIELAERKKEMSKELFRLLKGVYRKVPTDDLLQVLCTLMIRSSMCTKDCFAWYEMAVAKQLRITSLYEYYMMSADTRVDRKLPRTVLMYFAYHCDLDDRRKAYLFSLLVRHKDEIPELFHQYEDRLIEFALGQMEKGAISENLSILYRYLLHKEEAKLPKDKVQNIAFRHLIKMDREDIVRVIIVHEKLVEEAVYPVEHQRAYVDCYTDDYYVFMEDAKGNRYCDEECRIDIKLMAVEKLAMYLEQQAASDIGFFLYRTSIVSRTEQISEELLPMYEYLAKSKEIDSAYRNELSNSLLRMYFDLEQYDKLSGVFEFYDVQNATAAERAEIIRYLVYLEKDTKALDLLYNFGFENVPPKILARLLGRCLDEERQFEPKMAALVYYTFRLGKYTPDMVAYLCRYFDGSLKQMRDIYMAALSFDVDASAVAERILYAYLFTHSYLPEIGDVFAYYVGHRKREMVVQAYIADMAYRYFVNQQVSQPCAFEALEVLLIDECDVAFETMFAYLHYMATEVREYSERQKKLITNLVNKVVTERQYVPFFSQFSGFIPWLCPYTEFTYLEYKTMPGTQVTLHYLEENGQEQYHHQVPTEVCAGYYCHRFALFFGERVQYYFMERQGEEDVLTESGYLEKSDVTAEETETRYAILNDMIMCRALDDVRTMKMLKEKYEKNSLLAELVFGER